MAKADIPRMEVAGSSNIASAGYCSTQNCVDICFSNDAVYRYHDVSAKVWQDFLSAESKGRFVHSALKKYECERLDPEGGESSPMTEDELLESLPSGVSPEFIEELVEAQEE